MLVMLQQALGSGYLNSVISTIEKRYEIPSSTSGMLASMYGVGNVATILFVSYLGSQRHIPVFIGLGVLLMGISSLLFSLPHFISSPHTEHSPEGPNVVPRENVCHKGVSELSALGSLLQSSEKCLHHVSASLPVFFFALSQLLLGIGGSPLLTLGTAYIDNHVTKDAASLFISVVYSMVAFGPVLGFLLGAFFLKYNVDSFSFDTSTINTESGQWVGMWWGGFLVIGFLLLAIAVPFFTFPKQLKREKRNLLSKTSKAENEKQRETWGDLVLDQSLGEKVNNYGKSLIDLPISVWRLLTNWVYLASCFGACMELVIIAGFVFFLPKYLETQFSLSKSEASMVAGGTAIPGACLGILLGGFLLKKFSPGPRAALQLVLGLNVACFACYGLILFLGCSNTPMAGVTVPYPLTGYKILLCSYIHEVTKSC